MLVAMGEDPDREGLKATPKRAASAWTYLTRGYQQDPAALMKSAVFEAEAKKSAGLITLIQAGTLAALRGETTLEEVNRAI